MSSILKIFFGLAFFVVFFSCRKDNEIKVPSFTAQEILNRYVNLPANPMNYSSPALPSFFNNAFITIQNNTPADNPVTDWGATLGRVIFYDKLVSLNNSISCASCHQQQFGFTDTARLSAGFKGGATGRHSMSLLNAVYYSNGRFFWDERAASLEDQVVKPIQDKVEMGMNLDTLEKRMQSTEYYPLLFRYAFHTDKISRENIAKALAQFVRSMVSYKSKYDEGLSLSGNRLINFSNFTPEENIGKNIFMTNTNVNCSGCHNTDAFIMDNPRNNGINTTNMDSGIFVHTQNANDIGKFKAPSLKNVALRGRYMHDGSISGLSAVLNHYNIDIKPNPNLDNHLKDINGNPESMNLSGAELNALIAFLETLTDKKIITDEKFSNPFR